MNYISSEQIGSALSISDCIDVMEDLYLKEAGHLADQPPRTLTRIDKDSLILTMPCYSSSIGRFGVKIVSEYRNNPKYSHPVQGGLIVLIDGNNSKILCLLDSTQITAIRTGAIGGLGAKLLSRKDSKNVAVIGSGLQARTQLEAVSAVRDVRSAKVYSPNLGHSTLFAKEMSASLGIPVRAFEERSDATKGADIIILATNSSTPVLTWREVVPGCHIHSIGTLPDRREADEDTVCNSLLFADLRQGVLSEAGDVMAAIRSGRISESHIRGDLSELLQKPEIGRKDSTQVTMLKSVGFALQDLYASSFVYDKKSNH